MSEQNVELVRDALGRFVATGEVFREILDEDVVIEDHDIPDTRDYRGHAGFIRWMTDWGEPWAEWSLEPQEFIDAGDRVVVVLRMKARGRGSGVEIDREDSLVYDFRDGKVVRLDYFNTREQGLAAAGVHV
jgi:uncharacterized protein